MNTNVEKQIGRNLGRLREKAGLTQDMLAARLQTRGCDITRSALAKIEVGQRHIYADELPFFKAALGATWDEIFASTEQN